MAKCFDTFKPLGPAVVPLDEAGDPGDLLLRTWVDGELRQQARTSQLIWSIPHLVSHLSRVTTLLPGDVVLTGTPGGVGHKVGHRWLLTRHEDVYTAHRSPSVFSSDTFGLRADGPGSSRRAPCRPSGRASPHDLIALRRRSPADDMLSGLVPAEEDGSRLSGDEIVGMVMLLTAAGHETTTSLLVNVVRLLVDGHDAAPPWARDADRRRTAIEEVLRFEPPLQFNTRVLTEDVTLHGTTMPAGSGVALVVASAIRDPRVFADPDAFRPDRTHDPHLSFAGGIHMCLGASLARLETDVALQIVLDEFPSLRTLPGSARRKESATMHGFTAMAVHAPGTEPAVR